MGSPIDSYGEDQEQTRAVLHLALICEIIRNTSARGTVFPSHTFALHQELGPANSCGFLEQVPRHVPDSD